MKNIIFIAPIAAGKGTQSEMLKDTFGYVHISTGEIFREIIASGSELGMKVKDIINSGNLVDDDLTTQIVKNKLEEINGKPFILDGFPRNLTQASILNQIMQEKNLDYQVIYLELDMDTAMKRTLGRRICKCGKSYNIYFDHLKPKVTDTCDSCGSKLTIRDDDNEETFKVRYKTLMEKMYPVLDMYQDLGKVKVVDATKDVNEIFKSIVEVIQ